MLVPRGILLYEVKSFRPGGGYGSGPGCTGGKLSASPNMGGMY